jgi:cyclase
LAFAREAVRRGAGEILVNSIDRDGDMSGFDVPLVRDIAEAVDVPVIALGGAGTVEHFKEVITHGGASAVAAGSAFIFHGPRRAVLVKFLAREEIERLSQLESARTAARLPEAVPPSRPAEVTLGS